MFSKAAWMSYGRANIGMPKPGITFPLHLMFALFVGGYSCEYLALGSECTPNTTRKRARTVPMRARSLHATQCKELLRVLRPEASPWNGCGLLGGDILS